MNPPETAEHLALMRIVSYGLLFLIYLPLDDRGWTQVSTVFWMPISLFRMLPGPPRSPALIGVLQIVWKISLLTSAIGLVSRFSMVISAALGFFLLGLPNCFGKIHHLDGFPVLLLGILALSPCADALSVDQDPRRNRESWQYTWPVRLAQTLFLFVFFAAACAKLRNGGLAWMTGANMRSIWLGELFTHTPPTKLGSFLAQWRWVSRFAAVLTVAIELSALPAIFVRRLRVFALIGLFVLQVLIALLLGVYFTPQLVGYALFLPWERWYTGWRPERPPAGHGPAPRISLRNPAR
jgi:Vitamin K-dependent gamma-carboxylase